MLVWAGSTSAGKSVPCVSCRTSPTAETSVHHRLTLDTGETWVVDAGDSVPAGHRAAVHTLARSCEA